MNVRDKPPKDYAASDAPGQISGSSFLGDLFGGGGHGGEESPNSLRSFQILRVADLLSEGPIIGPWDGLKSIYYDGVPVQASNSDYNFDNFIIEGVSGTHNQRVIKGFSKQEIDITGPGQLLFGSPKTIRIANTYVDRCKIVVSVPQLLRQKDNGNIKPAGLSFMIRRQSNGGGYIDVGRKRISGKTNTQYQRQMIINLKGPPPWDIQLEKLTEDSEDLAKPNELYWDFYSEITDAKINYTLSSVLTHTVRADDFNSIPQRVVDCGGLLIQYPSNYNPESRVYTGVWDGTFVTGYCNNPAWVFYDLVIEGRYGIGDFIKAADVDKWELYSIAKWCDGRVPDGRGGTEPRWVFNGVILEQQEAYDLLANIASVWRGSAFWAGGQLVPTCDQPSEPVFVFSNANVIDGQFNYQSTDVSQRRNQVAVAWNDPTNLGERRLAIVEDLKSIAKRGILKTDAVAMGCTSESQAQRVGEWLMFTENYEGDTTTFTAGLEGAYVRPGNIAQVSDVNVSGARRSGRLVEVAADHVVLDASVVLRDGVNYFITCVRPNGLIITKGVHHGGSPTDRLNLNGAWDGPMPDIDTVWALASDDIEPTLWRVVRATPAESDRYDITAIAHRPDKWGVVERDRKLSDPDISNIGRIDDIKSLTAVDFMYQLSKTSIGNKLLVSWDSSAPYFDLAYREVDDNWHRLNSIAQKSYEFECEEETYEIWVTPRNSIGRRGKTTKMKYTVVGRTAPPKDPENFRVQVINGVALFQWAVSDEIDVLIGGGYEMRFSPKTLDATWPSSNKVLTSIPGTATTVELPYRPGTYFLRTRDIGGLMSETPAVVISSTPAKGIKEYIKINEHPLWEGTHLQTRILNPQKWLMIADPFNEGWYTFKNKIDMGDVFSVTLTVDMFAFPFIEGSTFVDERPGNVDKWQDWDNSNDDGDGMVTIQVSQTNQPPNTATEAQWSKWHQFIAGEYEGRGFRFRAWLAAPKGQNVGVETLSIIADVSSKQDSGNDIVWAGPKQHIAYTVKFFTIPSISIVIQNGATGDYYKITNKTKNGFDLELYNAANNIITGARSFDWIAAGW